MRCPTEEEMIEALSQAYDMGAEACKQVNFSRNGCGKTFTAKERAALNRILKRFGARKLTDEEYAMNFCR